MQSFLQFFSKKNVMKTHLNRQREEHFNMDRIKQRLSRRVKKSFACWEGQVNFVDAQFFLKGSIYHYGACSISRLPVQTLKFTGRMHTMVSSELLRLLCHEKNGITKFGQPVIVKTESFFQGSWLACPLKFHGKIFTYFGSK